MSVLLAGGGIRGGQAYGTSDKRGRVPGRPPGRARRTSPGPSTTRWASTTSKPPTAKAARSTCGRRRADPRPVLNPGPIQCSLRASLGAVLCSPSRRPPPSRSSATSRTALEIETDAARRPRSTKKGYVSGIAAGQLPRQEDRGAATSASACTSWTSCMAPGWRDDGYPRDPKLHGNLPKHYVEGPQICTQAKELKPEVIARQGLRRRHAALHVHQAGQGLQGRLDLGADARLPARRALRPVGRADHQRQRRGRPVLPHRHARPHQAQGRRHVRAGLPELPRQADPGGGVRRATSAPDAKFLYQRDDEQGPRADDPGLPGEAGRQAGPVAGRHDARPGGGVRGVVPPARLRLLHRGAAPARR